MNIKRVLARKKTRATVIGVKSGGETKWNVFDGIGGDELRVIAREGGGTEDTVIMRGIIRWMVRCCEREASFGRKKGKR